MDAKTAVFRADASPVIGSGHVMRCLALADELSSRGWICKLAVNVRAAESVSRLVSVAHSVVELSPQANRSAAGLRKAVKDRCDLLVADHYELDADFEVATRSWARSLLVIDDLANRSHECDVLVDQNAGRSREAYAHLVPDRACVLVGPTFALLRTEFLAARERRRGRREDRPIRRVLIAMGSTDPKNATGLALRALARSGLSAEIDVILSSAAPHLAMVQMLIRDLALPVRLHLNTPHVASLMVEADVALCAAGVTAFECCSLGLPIVLVETAENQSLGARALSAREAAILVGRIDAIDADAFIAALRLLDSESLSVMSKAGRALCDGRGAARIADVVTRNYDQAIVLRPATMTDAARLLEWRNDEASRRASRSLDLISEHEHRAWLKATLADPHALLRIAEWRGHAIGAVRCDLRANRAELSWAVDRSFRGIGLATVILRQMLEICPESAVAHIRKSNFPSQRVALKAGLTPTSDNGEWVVFGR